MRYKPNEKGDDGPQVKGSLNYLFQEYANKILCESSLMRQEIQHLVQSFSENGLTHDIDIVVALDTTLNKGLIVDGNRTDRRKRFETYDQPLRKHSILQ